MEKPSEPLRGRLKWLSGQSIPCTGDSQCKGPQLRACIGLRNSLSTSGAGVESRGTLVGVRVGKVRRGKGQSQSPGALEGLGLWLQTEMRSCRKVLSTREMLCFIFLQGFPGS